MHNQLCNDCMQCSLRYGSCCMVLALRTCTQHSTSLSQHSIAALKCQMRGPSGLQAFLIVCGCVPWQLSVLSVLGAGLLSPQYLLPNRSPKAAVSACVDSRVNIMVSWLSSCCLSNHQLTPSAMQVPHLFSALRNMSSMYWGCSTGKNLALWALFAVLTVPVLLLWLMSNKSKEACNAALHRIPAVQGIGAWSTFGCHSSACPSAAGALLVHPSSCLLKSA